MKNWLGIYGYSLKDVILNVAATNPLDLNSAQRLAGHIAQSNTKIYT
jgi:hypothetical protein